jgi:hypothetical protein
VLVSGMAYIMYTYNRIVTFPCSFSLLLFMLALGRQAAAQAL